MGSFFKKQWFLIALVFLIAAGIAAGETFHEEQLAWVSKLIRPKIITAIVLFLMAFSLDSRQLHASFRAPKPVFWASLINLAFVPLLAWAMLPLQQSRDFVVGLMIAASVPCTMSSASVWSRKAAGNDAISLLVTLLTNGVCVFATPFWLRMATSGVVSLSLSDMMEQLVIAALLPIAAGQGLRAIPAAAAFGTRHKASISAIAQALVLSMVFSAAADAGARMSKTASAVSAGSVAIAWGCAIVLHLAALLVAYFGALRFGFTRADCTAVAFSASQKTLPIGVLLATDPKMFGNPELGIPFAVFPMLMYHASQLFIDTAFANHWAARARDEHVARAAVFEDSNRVDEFTRDDG